MAKEFLSQRDVEFETVDIADLDDAVGTLRAITGGPIATPVVVVGAEHRVGFDPDWMAARLDAGESPGERQETKPAAEPNEQ